LSNALHPVDEVVDGLLSQAKATGQSIVKSLDTALGHYLYRDICSPVDVPPAANSAMDGYAAAQGSLEVGGVYEVSDRIPAGTLGKSLKPGTLARIFTGAPMPEDADTVVIQEDTTDLGDDKVQVNEIPGLADNVRPRGQDIVQGEVILARGHRLKPQDLALIASVGIPEVEVYRPLTISIMSTGDELVEPPEALRPGQIYNANRYALAGLIRGLGMEVLDLGLVADTPEATREALRQGALASDCILSTGGVSVGEEDYVRAAVESMGSLDIWRLAIKPGKPLAYGTVSGTPFFGLPGNPVSTFVTFMMIARPYLIAIQGGNAPKAKHFYGVADFNFSAGNRREYLRTKIQWDENAEVTLSKYSNQGSGIMSSVSWADTLAEVEIGQQITPGDKIKYYLI
jgi:molybdopterin molybdotransferase